MGIPLRVIDAPGRMISGTPLPAEDDLASVDVPGSGALLKAGDMWRESELDGVHGECWAIVLPNRTVWYSTVSAEDGSYWKVTGSAPALTVHPSIDDRDTNRPWHGWIRNGELVSA
ncbi:MAG: DUF6527 family protein [Actinocrinis sp.]